jgi:hypothetical protein
MYSRHHEGKWAQPRGSFEKLDAGILDESVNANKYGGDVVRLNKREAIISHTVFRME